MSGEIVITQDPAPDARIEADLEDQPEARDDHRIPTPGSQPAEPEEA